jgi:3-hydroxybutyryl-CoA dehydratase
MDIKSYTFEELEEGMSATHEVDLTDEMIEAFSKLTGDVHPLHSDAEYAVECGFDFILAHGMLTSSFASTLVGMLLPGKNALLLSQSFRYLRPVYGADRLKVSGEIVSKVDADRQISVDVRIRNGQDQIVAMGEMAVKLRA